MNKSKKLLLLGLSVLFSQASMAEVVKLDHLNPDNCRQQLMSVEDDYPVVVVYRSDLPEQDQMMATYEKLSEEYAHKNIQHVLFSNLMWLIITIGKPIRLVHSNKAMWVRLVR